MSVPFALKNVDVRDSRSTLGSSARDKTESLTTYLRCEAHQSRGNMVVVAVCNQKIMTAAASNENTHQ